LKKKEASKAQEVLKYFIKIVSLKVARSRLSARALTRTIARIGKETKKKIKPYNQWMKQFFKNRI
jgi:hypothetical protein